jgi:hypothetical protein
MSATFPSEIQTPLTLMSPSLVKREEVEKTPISPPAAYLSFLSKMSTPPATSPPPSASLTGPSQSDRPTLTSHVSVESVSSAASETSEARTAESVTSEVRTTESVTSERTETTESEASQATVLEAESISTTTQATKPSSPRVRSLSCAEVSTVSMGKPTSRPTPRPINIPLPMSPYSPGPESARSLKRLQIPQSPYSPRMASPSMTSPLVTSPFSASGMISPFSSAYSPRDREFGSGAVGLRQTVTRYISIPNKGAPVMEPVPASKKRKIEQA